MTLWACSVCGNPTTRSSGICTVCVNVPLPPGYEPPTWTIEVTESDGTEWANGVESETITEAPEQ